MPTTPQQALSPALAPRRTRAQWMVLIAAFLGWMFDGVEQGVFPLVARPALQDLLGVESDMKIGPWIALITACFLVGAAFGGLAFGWLGDRVGRVRAMILSILAYSLFTGCCYFVHSAWQLGLFRFLAAIGMGGEWSLGVALIMECWPEGLRPLLAGAIGVASNLGFTLVGVLGMLHPVTRDGWRWVMLAGATPALLTLFIACYVPESERWKESLKTHGANPFRTIFGPGLRRTTLLGLLFASIALIGTWASVQWLPSWADQLTHGADRYAKGMTTMLTGAGAMIGAFVGPWIGGRFGRRPAYFLLCLASLVSCACLFHFVTEYGWLFQVMTLVVGLATASFFGWLPLYLPELFPTRVRATGQGLCYNAGRLIAAVGVLQTGHLLQFYQGSYARAGATITLVYGLGLGLIWLAPETKGKPLPE